MFGNYGLHARRVVHGVVKILDVGAVYAKDEVDGVTTQPETSQSTTRTFPLRGGRSPTARLRAHIGVVMTSTRLSHVTGSTISQKT